MELKSQLTPESQAALDVIDRQTLQMSRLIDDLLDIARITSNKLELRRQCIDVREVLDAAVETSRPLIDQLGHTLTVEAPTESIPIDGDLVRLAQVISNLLNNAAKYTEPGGDIWLTAAREGNQVVIKVRDNGMGISPELMPHIFEMFAQADRAAIKSPGGLGIGLTLVKRLVKMHGGTITAHSDGRARGSEFVMRVPLATSEPLKSDVGVKSKQKLSTERGAPIRILVVDDNHASTDSLGLLLKLLGNEVRIAHDGLAAVEAAREFEPRVVLLDIGLPKLNGYETAQEIRQQPWASQAVLIALTGWGRDVDRERSRQAGFDHHLVKPLDPDVLTQLLAELQGR